MLIADIRVGQNHSRPSGVGCVKELAASMEEHGQLYPVLVDSDNNLLSGFRRAEAAKQLGWTHIDAAVREPDDSINLVENLIRKDLSLWDQIMGIRTTFGDAPVKAEICRKLSKSSTWVNPRVDVWTLPDEFLAKIRLGKVDISQLRGRLKRERGPSVTQKHFGYPSHNDIKSAVTELMRQGRTDEARALGYACGVTTRDKLLADRPSGV